MRRLKALAEYCVLVASAPSKVVRAVDLALVDQRHYRPMDQVVRGNHRRLQDGSLELLFAEESWGLCLLEIVGMMWSGPDWVGFL